ncbi:glucose-1-phosphate adenylyltransferase, partial [Pantoea dispersa]|nr:glucose-1-phosphate adenylyltransferase [Pantoea dispersa]
DLLSEDCDLDLFDHGWRIYSVNPNQPPQYISSDAIVKESLINEGCTIEGEVDTSVLFQGVTVGKGSIIKESVIMPDAIIGDNCLIEKAI